MLAPELDKYRDEIKDVIRQEEDVLSYALFPQVALKFFEARNKAEEPVLPNAPEASETAPQAEKTQKTETDTVTVLYVEDLTI